MAANRQISIGPVALTITLTTNIMNSTITSLAGPIGYTQTQPYIILTFIRVVNKHASIVAKVSLWKGATGGNVAGTEFVFFQSPVAVGGYIDRSGRWRFEPADFLVGGSDTATALTFEAEGEIGLV
jgi:hypothetical protein